MRCKICPFHNLALNTLQVVYTTKLIIACFTSTRGVYHKKEFLYFRVFKLFFSYGLKKAYSNDLKKAYSNDLLVQGWGTFCSIQFYPQHTHVLNQLLITKFSARWGNMYNHKTSLIKCLLSPCVENLSNPDILALI